MCMCMCHVHVDCAVCSSVQCRWFMGKILRSLSPTFAFPISPFFTSQFSSFSFANNEKYHIWTHTQIRDCESEGCPELWQVCAVTTVTPTLKCHNSRPYTPVIFINVFLFFKNLLRTLWLISPVFTLMIYRNMRWVRCTGTISHWRALQCDTNIGLMYHDTNHANHVNHQQYHNWGI